MDALIWIAAGAVAAGIAITIGAVAQHRREDVAARDDGHVAYRLRQAKNGRHYYQVIGANNKILVHSQMYSTRRAALRGAASLHRVTSEAPGLIRDEPRGGVVELDLDED